MCDLVFLWALLPEIKRLIDFMFSTVEICERTQSLVKRPCLGGGSPSLSSALQPTSGRDRSFQLERLKDGNIHVSFPVPVIGPL